MLVAWDYLNLGEGEMWLLLEQLPQMQRVHCKELIPKIRNKYSQKRNCAATVPISTLMCLWAIYILYCYERSAYSAAGNMWTAPSKKWITHRHMNVEKWDWGRAIPRKGIHKQDFCCSVCTANNFEFMYSWKRISQNSFPKFIYIFSKSFMKFWQELLDAAGRI